MLKLEDVIAKKIGDLTVHASKLEMTVELMKTEIRARDARIKELEAQIEAAADPQLPLDKPAKAEKANGKTAH